MPEEKAVGRLSLSQRLSLELFRKLAVQASRNHELRQLFWECTLRCNLRCRHCGSDCRVQSETADMPFETFARALDSIAANTDPHRVFVIITGGEPLMRTDLEKCGLEIYRKGFPWGIVTNGFALTEERFERLRRSGMHAITISLDGLEDSHDWMRGREGSWSRATQAIRFVARSGILHDVVTCVNARNIDQLPAIRDFLIDSGVRGWRIFTVFPQGRAKDDPDMKLSGAQIRQVMDFIRSVRKEGRIACSFACEGFLGRYEGEVRDSFFFCNAGVSVASVLSDGSISACASIRADYVQGNVNEDDFWEVWNGRFGKYRDRSWMRTGPCADCSHFRYCQGNGMHLRDENGNLMQCLLRKMENIE